MIRLLGYATGACLLSVLVPSCRPLESHDAGPARPNIILITLDTTRADHLSCYGYARKTSANLDRLAAEGTLFSRAIAQASVTPVSHASILTGLNPYHHGLRVLHGLFDNRLAESHVTLAEVLKTAGYQTAAFVSAFPASERFGLNQGFDTFNADFLTSSVERIVTAKGFVNTGKNQRRADKTTDRALAWLGKAKSPFFLWVHYFDPHDPQLRPPKEMLTLYASVGGTRHENLINLYDVEIQYMDQQMGRLLEAIEQADPLKTSLIAVVADHGQSLGDHNWWTHGILYQEQVRVPLIFHGPTIPRGRRIDFMVRSIDIMPTLLDLSGIDAEHRPKMDGRSLVPLLEEHAEDPGYQAYCDSVNMLVYRSKSGLVDRKNDMLFAIIDGQWKYIHHMLHPDQSELYDLSSDPKELVNLVQSRRDVAEHLKESLFRRRFLPAEQLERTEHMSKEDLDRLKSLGYVGQ